MDHVTIIKEGPDTEVNGDFSNFNPGMYAEDGKV
jgi:hypothetical protein